MPFLHIAAARVAAIFIPIHSGGGGARRPGAGDALLDAGITLGVLVLFIGLAAGVMIIADWWRGARRW